MILNVKFFRYIVEFFATKKSDKQRNCPFTN
jgi:hypothetical protein